MSCSGTFGGAVTISTSGNRDSDWPLYVSSNNKLRQQHSTKSFSVLDSCQFTSGPYHFSDAPLFRPLGRMQNPAGGAGPAGRGVRVWPGGRNNGASEKLYGLQVNWQLSNENIASSSLSHFIISENIPVSSAAAQWMNKDRSYYFTTLLISSI